MKFSIRTLLAITLLTALLFETGRSWTTFQFKEKQLHQTLRRIEQLTLSIAPNSGRVGQTMTDTEAELQSTKSIANQAVEGLERIQQKHSTFENRGDDVFSMRTIPTISENGNATARFRLVVPAARPIWLCLGIVPSPVYQNAFYDQEDPVELLSESPFTHTGPYEFQLTPGVHEVRVSVSRRGPPSIRLEIDNGVHFESSYIGESNPWMTLTAANESEQKDFPADRRPPWLLVGNVQDYADVKRRQGQHLEEINLWFDDRSRGFESFPGVE